LFGNYEGSFRNDNGQSDPNISSLFDFTQGDFNLLGQQFTPGVFEYGRSSPCQWLRELHVWESLHEGPHHGHLRALPNGYPIQ